METPKNNAVELEETILHSKRRIGEIQLEKWGIGACTFARKIGVLTGTDEIKILLADELVLQMFYLGVWYALKYPQEVKETGRGEAPKW